MPTACEPWPGKMNAIFAAAVFAVLVWGTSFDSVMMCWKIY
jgi:hypothetical protein